MAFANVDGAGKEDDAAAAMLMDDGGGMDFGVEAEDKIVMALTTAGVTVEKAKIYAPSMCKREVYGRSVRDQSLLTRRNLKVKGLNALDMRTTKPNGQPWDVLQTRRSQARQTDDR